MFYYVQYWLYQKAKVLLHCTASLPILADHLLHIFGQYSAMHPTKLSDRQFDIGKTFEQVCKPWRYVSSKL